MFKKYFEKIILNALTKKLVIIFDAILSKLGVNGAKTIFGILVALLAVVQQAFPQAAPFLNPVFDFLNTKLAITSDTVLFAGVSYATFVGLLHKFVKFLKDMIEKAK